MAEIIQVLSILGLSPHMGARVADVATVALALGPLVLFSWRAWAGEKPASGEDRPAGEAASHVPPRTTTLWEV